MALLIIVHLIAKQLLATNCLQMQALTIIAKYEILSPVDAGVAQQVEQLICNQQVRGSNPFTSLSRN